MVLADACYIVKRCSVNFKKSNKGEIPLINSTRLHERLTALAAIGTVSETGVSRPAHSPEDRKAMDQTAAWMKEAGMTAEIDAFGNLIGVYEGTDPSLPRLVLGSHIDSQPAGGRFDGTIGVLGAVEVVQSLHERQIRPARTIEVAAFADEEGFRFNKGLFGVRGATGKLEPGELERRDEQGISRRDALKAIGITPAENAPPRYTNETVHAFLELHIEQGPLLESRDLPVGIVSGISGPLWLTAELEGYSGHAGSVPMHMRRDALVGAARVIHLFDDLVKSEPDSPAVGTVGYIKNYPNSRNSISDRVTFTIDLRDIVPARRKRLEEKFYELLRSTEELYGLRATVTEDTNSEPKYCADWIRGIMNKELADMGAEPFELMSGPFHDALIMADCCPFGMIFVRCKDGLSHHPDEFASIEDISAGTELLYRTALRIAQNDSPADQERGKGGILNESHI